MSALTVIYKYEVPLHDFGLVTIPRRFRVLSVACQGDRVFFWAEVDPHATARPLGTAVRGTGHHLNVNDGKYAGTAFDQRGLVRHVYLEALEGGDDD